MRIQLAVFFLLGNCLLGCDQSQPKETQTIDPEGFIIQSPGFLACDASFLTSGQSENQTPEITNVKIKFKKATGEWSISYDLDDDDEQLTVEPLILDETGRYIEIPDEDITGDWGSPISKGKNKQITLRYQPPKNTKNLRVVLTAMDSYNYASSNLIALTDTTRIKAKLESIYGVRHHATNKNHLDKCKKIISDHFIASGFQVKHQSFLYSGYKAQNIIARKTGLGHPHQKILVAGHYDTTSQSPGADDNASGIAALMEIATVLAEIPLDYTLEIVAFDLEEFGMLGAKKYVEKQNKEEDGEILGMINLDMIGYKSDQPGSQSIPQGLELAFPTVFKQVKDNEFVADFIVCIANERTKEFRNEYAEYVKKNLPDQKLISILTPGNGEILRELRYSDHAPFWDAGYKAIFIGDGADSRNPNYHSANDTLGTINYEYLNQSIKSVLGFVAEKCHIRHATTVCNEISVL